MKTAHRFLTCFLVIFIGCGVYAKSNNNYPQNYFRNPLNIPLQLAANFGEVRPNHFHMGFDIRTQGRENLPVHAAADGYISRIKIEKWGYGRAIYITHPNGYTTVYGHLNNFYPALDKYVKQQQYASTSWEQDIIFSPQQFPVSKGDFIAFSGNTGGSAGPHLHFEIRDTKTENCLNPRLFGFDIPDKIAPVIYSLYWYDRRYSTYQLGPNKINILRKGNDYISAQKTVKVGSPLLSLGIYAEDKSSNSPFMFGIYGASLYMDNVLLNSFALDDFSYPDSRYVNACIDYSTYIKSKMPIQYLCILPGNQLPVFDDENNNGTIMLTDTLPHKIRLVVKDAAGNESTLITNIQYSAALQKDYAFTMNSVALTPGKENSIEGENVKAVFPEPDFYDVVPFVLNEQPIKGKAKASSLIQLHNQYVPVDDSFSVQIKTTLPVNDPLRNHVVMYKITGAHKEANKGQWIGDWMQAKFNRLGTFQLLIDTIPPVVTPLGWKSGAVFTAQKFLKLRCKDELDEIEVFTASLDGQWLMFGKKDDDFIYEFDEHCPPGQHELTVTATDIAGNISVKKFSFTRK